MLEGQVMHFGKKKNDRAKGGKDMSNDNDGGSQDADGQTAVKEGDWGGGSLIIYTGVEI